MIKKRTNKGVKSVVSVIVIITIIVLIISLVSNYLVSLGTNPNGEIDYADIDYNMIDDDTVEFIWVDGSGFDNITFVDSEGYNRGKITSVGESIIVDDFEEIGIYADGDMYIDSYENIMNVKYSISDGIISFDGEPSRVKYLKLYDSKGEKVLIYEDESINYRQKLRGDYYRLYAVTDSNNKVYIDDFK